MYLCFIYILSARIYVFTDASGAGYAPNLPDHATLHACKVPYSRRVLTYLFPFASHIFFSAPASHIFVLRGRITVAIEAPPPCSTAWPLLPSVSTHALCPSSPSPPFFLNCEQCFIAAIHMHTDVGMLAAFWTWPQTELAPISSFFESKSNRKYKFFYLL